MARSNSRTDTINVRLPRPMVARLDALVQQAGASPDLEMVTNVTRSDVLRLALLRGLAQLEAEYGGHPVLPGMEAAR